MPWTSQVPERFQNEGETYLGYSVEAECMAVDVHPTEERPKQSVVLHFLSSLVVERKG